MDSSDRSPDGYPINLGAVARRIRDYILNANCVERFQTLQREKFAQCISGTRDEVLSDDGWIEEDWSD